MIETARLAGLKPDVDDATVLAHLHAWIAEDRKATPLKTLQGLIWAEGYAQTGLRGHVYPDAAAGLRRWHDAGLLLYVYSSGSVEAQRVLFANSVHGDLTPLFSGNFDTAVGSKREAASYRVIADVIGLAPADIVFLSDVDAELDARTQRGDADGAAAASGRHPGGRDDGAPERCQLRRAADRVALSARQRRSARTVRENASTNVNAM